MGKMKIIIYCWLLVFTLAENEHTYFWRDYRGTIPRDAISFENLYIAQVPNNGLLPATLYPKTGEAVTEVNGKKLVVKSGIKVLCDQYSASFSWEYTNVNKLTEDILKDCVIGGTEANSTLYIGKSYNEGEWKIGKVFPLTSQWKGLRIWNNNGELYKTDDFQILKYKTLPIHIFEVREGA